MLVTASLFVQRLARVYTEIESNMFLVTRVFIRRNRAEKTVILDPEGHCGLQPTTTVGWQSGKEV